MAMWANGSVLELRHVATDATATFLVEREKSQLTFCRLDAPYEKLKVAQTGDTSWGAGGGKFASFTPIAAPDEALYTFQLCANQKKANAAGGEGWYLGVGIGATGVALGHSRVLIGHAAPELFAVTQHARKATLQLDASCVTSSLPQLSPSQIDSFMREGYLVLPSAVPVSLVHEALRQINHELGKPGMMIEGGVEGAAKLAGNTSNSAAIRNLFFGSSVATYVASLVGEIAPPQGAQIALRFPELGPAYEPKGNEWHTDGMRQGKWNPFSLLVGIALSDVQQPQSGNLIVFPKSHHALHGMLQEGGVLAGCATTCTSVDTVWGDGHLPDLGPPIQLLCSKGDVVLCHPKMAHRGGPNLSCNIRYQVYFRIKHALHDDRMERAKTDLFADLDGCQNNKAS
ncbi:hypothetical protein SPRG_09922 [Saprolegnia parasitica CBS 223.65]|uniref:Phytanoyl-CoA dioxygenase n=1 Tax=Saprolegnia parasitica (strain CBS 223.65) TaxID=695850 RepID=A0A067C578_SAPPC|nr:hypothetical protein SPRG_09922 [Saprolegnia parasitica CBS 223.65]KDO24285.1 hypothetical protein SPRG_09922 [Saprolegnia parasitica CBS 223.65]|eukprot:XP_012205056.1 hypothetical protein SPRG_09922 [Saprolegnia parasitica CBS 223.65]